MAEASPSPVVQLPAVVAWLERLDAVYAENKDWLTDLDAAIGDADHGINMARGFAAVHRALDAEPPTEIGAALKLVAMTLLKTVGGASGPLYGTFFLKASVASPGSAGLDPAALECLFRDGAAGIAQRGKAVVGDKTMIDAWEPAIQALAQARADGGSIGQMLAAAAQAAEAGRDATVPLVARKGRASYLGERSRNHMDPGAASTTLMLQAARDLLTPGAQDA
jgi:dihydroxyacetone kinase-like protein